MIRYFRALAWLRWHLVVNSLRPTRKRDSLERASRVFQVAGPVLAFLLFVPAILMMGILGLAGGWFLADSSKFLGAVLVVLRLLLVLEFILTLLTPLLRATQGAPPNLTRFLLLPVSPRFLYTGEALSGLGDPWLAILASGLLCLPLGWVLGGGSGAGGLLTLSAGLAILALLTGLSALASSFTHLVFRDRRRGELVSLVLLIVIAAGGMLPGILSLPERSNRRPPVIARPQGQREVTPELSPRTGEQEARPGLAAAGGGIQEWDGRVLPSWVAAYPPELYVRCVALASDGRFSAGLLPLGLLLLWAAGSHWVASRIHRRLLETPEIHGTLRGGEGSGRWIRIPGLASGASAVALAQVRLIFRTVQGKIALCLTPLVILMFGFMWSRRPDELAPEHLPVPFGVVLAFGGVVFALLTLEACTLNQFAMDRAGLSLEFLAPLSERELVGGKAAGAAILAASRAVPCYLAALIVAPGGSPFLWMAVPVAGAAIFCLLAPGGAILSIYLPKTMDVGRLGQAGKPHPGASFLGMLLIAAGAGPSVAAGLLGVLLLRSPALAFLLVTGWAALAAAISVPLFRYAERSLHRRRENLALVAQGR